MKRIYPATDIYGITDFGLSLGRTNVDVVRQLLEAGVKIIQYREKDRKMGVMYEECLAIRALTREYGACFIINDHVPLVQLTDADGIHVGQEDLPLPQVRQLVGPDRIIGLSTHSPAQAAQAIKNGADYIGVGPVFATQTKKDVCAPVGLNYVRHVADTLSIPFVAIGGIKTQNIQSVRLHGATCCAVISGIVSQPDIAAAVADLRASMHAKQ